MVAGKLKQPRCASGSQVQGAAVAGVWLHDIISKKKIVSEAVDCCFVGAKVVMAI